MAIDDENREENYSFGDDRENALPTGKEDSHSRSGTPPLQYEGPYLTNKEFIYTMGLLDKKITTLYRLCRHISEQQQENSKSLKKLVAIDELSEQFWNVSFFNISSKYFFKKRDN
jgi:hypothetical protein